MNHLLSSSGSRSTQAVDVEMAASEAAPPPSVRTWVDHQTVDLLMSTEEESQTFLQKAIQEQGRGDQMKEIQRRPSDEWRSIEVVLARHHDCKLISIGVQEFIRVPKARKLQNNTWILIWACLAIILLLVIILFSILSLETRNWNKD